MTIKIGIVGAGCIADYHIKGFREAGADVVAIADQNLEKCEKFATGHMVERMFPSLTEMLGRVDLDAVSVITPNRFHRQLVEEALAAGKHVFCEKPPALNAAETISMRNAAQRAKKTLMFNFNNRARSESRMLMNYIAAGEVGRINSAQAVWMRRTGIPGFGGWFTNKAMSGGGPVIDLLHMIDLALYFMGSPEPEYVMAQTFNDFISDRSFKGPWGIPDVADGVTDVETACHGFIRFKTGQVLTIRNSWAEMIKREEVTVTFQGQKAGGMIQRLFQTDGDDDTAMDCCELYTQEHSSQVNRYIVTTRDESMGRIGSAINFVQVLKDEAAPLNTPDEAVRLMQIIDAIYHSAESGKPVEVNMEKQ